MLTTLAVPPYHACILPHHHCIPTASSLHPSPPCTAAITIRRARTHHRCAKPPNVVGGRI
ncbi:hypothetical protein E2C01_078959 [Portunus trituberculatus]|uniref:Uncharacterized protein n=1 Tax=Portunus trituberculatus TaxID=210409 RepID=A0A5B7IIE9_PORTR|nr:hypothetical protein [Portunus trituberculatus]